MPTHTQSHTQTLKHKGILSEVDPYQVLCQSPGAMRYLVPRICLNTLASLFGSTDSQTQPSNECRLFTYVVNCAALFPSGTQTEKGRAQPSRVSCWSLHLLCMRLHSAQDKRIQSRVEQKKRGTSSAFSLTLMSLRAPRMDTKIKNARRSMSAVAEHGQAHVTIIDMLTLQFTTPAACPSADRHAFKKLLACSRCRSPLSSTMTLVC